MSYGPLPWVASNRPSALIHVTRRSFLGRWLINSPTLPLGWLPLVLIFKGRQSKVEGGWAIIFSFIIVPSDSPGDSNAPSDSPGLAGWGVIRHTWGTNNWCSVSGIRLLDFDVSISVWLASCACLVAQMVFWGCEKTGMWNWARLVSRNSYRLVCMVCEVEVRESERVRVYPVYCLHQRSFELVWQQHSHARRPTCLVSAYDQYVVDRKKKKKRRKVRV